MEYNRQLQKLLSILRRIEYLAPEGSQFAALISLIEDAKSVYGNYKLWSQSLESGEALVSNFLEENSLSREIINQQITDLFFKINALAVSRNTGQIKTEPRDFPAKFSLIKDSLTQLIFEHIKEWPSDKEPIPGSHLLGSASDLLKKPFKTCLLNKKKRLIGRIDYGDESAQTVLVEEIKQIVLEKPLGEKKEEAISKIAETSLSFDKLDIAFSTFLERFANIDLDLLLPYEQEALQSEFKTFIYHIISSMQSEKGFNKTYVSNLSKSLLGHIGLATFLGINYKKTISQADLINLIKLKQNVNFTDNSDEIAKQKNLFEALYASIDQINTSLSDLQLFIEVQKANYPSKIVNTQKRLNSLLLEKKLTLFEQLQLFNNDKYKEFYYFIDGNNWLNQLIQLESENENTFSFYEKSFTQWVSFRTNNIPSIYAIKSYVEQTEFFKNYHDSQLKTLDVLNSIKKQSKTDDSSLEKEREQTLKEAITALEVNYQTECVNLKQDHELLLEEWSVTLSSFKKKDDIEKFKSIINEKLKGKLPLNQINILCSQFSKQIKSKIKIIKDEQFHLFEPRLSNLQNKLEKLPSILNQLSEKNPCYLLYKDLEKLLHEKIINLEVQLKSIYSLRNKSLKTWSAILLKKEEDVCKLLKNFSEIHSKATELHTRLTDRAYQASLFLLETLEKQILRIFSKSLEKLKNEKGSEAKTKKEYIEQLTADTKTKLFARENEYLLNKDLLDKIDPRLNVLLNIYFQFVRANSSFINSDLVLLSPADYRARIERAITFHLSKNLEYLSNFENYEFVQWLRINLLKPFQESLIRSLQKVYSNANPGFFPPTVFACETESTLLNAGHIALTMLQQL